MMKKPVSKNAHTEQRVWLLGGGCHANRQMIKAANVLFDAPLRDQFCVLGGAIVKPLANLMT